MKNVKKRSVALHERFGGKLEVKSKVPLKNRDDLSLAYTPGVAEVSKQIAKHPARAWRLTMKRNTIAVVSDGSAVLGLGNLGALGALPVMEGKCVLFKELGKVDAFPICLATQDTDEIVQTVLRIASQFGGINLEDISAPRCFEIEKRLNAALAIPVFHDDQHGAAVVTLAALINALKLKKLNKKDAIVVINGAGAAGTATAKLLLKYGINNIIVCDTKGIIYKGRKGLPRHKQELARLTNPRAFRGGLSEAVEGADVFIGMSVKNVFTPQMVTRMHPRPVIFALANPDPEIDPRLAKRAGAFIVATGRSDFPNQINNMLAFPGIFRGALDHHVTHITSQMLLQVAENLARYVRRLTPEHILPNPLDHNVCKVVARAIKK